MLKIGEFSKLSRVSIRMLRHYDDIGLLKPAEIDEFTGYRYYHEEQLFTIGRITSLKDMGFALADIIKILDCYDDKEKIDAFLSERQKESSKHSKETEYKLMLLETARKRLRKEQMGEAYATVAAWIKANGYKMNGHMFNIYHVSPAQTQNPDEYVTEACSRGAPAPLGRPREGATGACVLVGPQPHSVGCKKAPPAPAALCVASNASSECVCFLKGV